MSISAKIKVLIVDDSALIRQMLSEILSRDPDIEVVGAAADPLKARELIKQTNPDVLTLDIEMPKMNGLDFLKKIMTLRPMPVIMISSMTDKGADITLQALEIGAVDCVLKPKINIKNSLGLLASELIEKVKMAKKANIHKETMTPTHPIGGIKKEASSIDLIAIGASTGGVEAVHAILDHLPPVFPPIIVVQHMAAQFMEQYAKRLDETSKLTACLAQEGTRLVWNHIYIAPGDCHLEVVSQDHNIYATLNNGAAVRGHRPSVDVLFHSVADQIKDKSIGIILSGMGKDGADGLLEMRKAGALTLGQSEESCVIYGMPRVAKENGAVVEEMNLDKMTQRIIYSIGQT